MTREPLVSIMMPACNAASTLPMALASLLVQTYENWECIIVDDGSCDNTQELLSSLKDKRFKVISFSENKGRPFARQTALDHISGEFLGMLDADDWYYPRKLELQVQTLIENEKLALVSAGMATTDANGYLVGVRGFGNEREQLPLVCRKVCLPPVAHAPSLIRSDLAKKEKYDLRFNVAQDVDFLLRIMGGRQYTIIHEPLYVYNEVETVTAEKILQSHRNVRRMFWKYRFNSPLNALLEIAKSYVKTIIYREVFFLGIRELVVANRATRSTSKQEKSFIEAKKTVERVIGDLF
jgi:glycosyltransferase involved in cell wall biosynthesis